MLQLIVDNLTKKYKNKTIIQNASFILTSEKYNFFIGENGTGKSTMIKCILGEVKYEGLIDKNNLNIAYAPEQLILPEYITVYNFLKLLGLTKNHQKQNIDYDINYYLKCFDILEYRNRLIHQLSKGTKQKILLIQTFMSEADIYLFDEPLGGLDEESRKHFLNELRRLKRKNKLIIICTHYLEEYHFKAKTIINFPIRGNI